MIISVPTIGGFELLVKKWLREEGCTVRQVSWIPEDSVVTDFISATVVLSSLHLCSKFARFKEIDAGVLYNTI